MLRMELPGKRKRGKPKRRFMDVVKEDMAEVEVTEEDTVDRNILTHFGSNLKVRFGFSTRSLGHVMFWLAGTTQEAGAGGR